MYVACVSFKSRYMYVYIQKYSAQKIPESYKTFTGPVKIIIPETYYLFSGLTV